MIMIHRHYRERTDGETTTAITVATLHFSLRLLRANKLPINKTPKGNTELNAAIPSTDYVRCKHDIRYYDVQK